MPRSKPNSCKNTKNSDVHLARSKPRSHQENTLRFFASSRETSEKNLAPLRLCARSVLSYLFHVPDVTEILNSIEQGDPKAADELLPLVYQELRSVAAAKMAREQPGQTLQATALVHEAWMRLAKGKAQHWDNRRHFFAAAAEAMRRILIERARRKQAKREAGVASYDELPESRIVVQASSEDLLSIHEALNTLAEEEPDCAELVKLRYFVGMNMAQAAEAMGKSLRATERLWTFAKTWMRHELGK